MVRESGSCYIFLLSTPNTPKVIENKSKKGYVNVAGWAWLVWFGLQSSEDVRRRKNRC